LPERKDISKCLLTGVGHSCYNSLGVEKNGRNTFAQMGTGTKTERKYSNGLTKNKMVQTGLRVDIDIRNIFANMTPRTRLDYASALKLPKRRLILIGLNDIILTLQKSPIREFSTKVRS
jgi:hypothetical protein